MVGKNDGGGGVRRELWRGWWEKGEWWIGMVVVIWKEERYGGVYIRGCMGGCIGGCIGGCMSGCIGGCSAYFLSALYLRRTR